MGARRGSIWVVTENERTFVLGIVNTTKARKLHNPRKVRTHQQIMKISKSSMKISLNFSLDQTYIFVQIKGIWVSITKHLLSMETYSSKTISKHVQRDIFFKTMLIQFESH